MVLALLLTQPPQVVRAHSLAQLQEVGLTLLLSQLLDYLLAQLQLLAQLLDHLLAMLQEVGLTLLLPQLLDYLLA